jgi:zinc/manganese transport system substrate-binding protein
VAAPCLLVAAFSLVTAVSAPLAGAAQVRSSARRPVQVVAAENFWGSIAAQLGGSRAHVTSIIANPDVDPHSYEPTAADARTVAAAQLVIENGIGYDPWVPKLLAADDTSATVVNVGQLLGVPDGDNPHRWYDPAAVQRVVATVTSDLERLDPADRTYFERRRVQFDKAALRPYDAVMSTIRARYSGTPVGASESIFAMLSPALGLRLLTPPSFLRAVSEGTDVSAADKEMIDRQISRHQIKVYVYNSQNVTPDVQAQLRAVKAAGIAVATITETLEPATATYQAWQTRQLLGIEKALAKAVGRGHRRAPQGPRP